MADIKSKNSSLNSGKKHVLESIQLEFWEFDDDTKDKSKAAPVKSIKTDQGLIEKWIYVFKKHPWGISISSEIFIDTNGKYNLVDWRQGGDKWAGKDSRSATVKQERFVIGMRKNSEGFILLSQIQLPYSRLMAYLENSNGVSGVPPLQCRAINLSDENYTQYTDDGRCIVYLLDYVRLAELLQKNCLKSLEEYYNEVASNEEKASERYLARLTWDVATIYAEKDDDVWEWIKTEELRAYIKNLDQKLDDLKAVVEKWGKRKYGLMSLPAYEEMREDYNGVAKLEDLCIKNEANLIEGSIESLAGRNYLEIQLEKEKSWYNRYLLNEKPFLTGRRAVGTVKEFAKFLKEIAIAKIKKNEIKAMEDVGIAIRKRLIIEPHLMVLPNGETKWVAIDEWEPSNKARQLKYQAEIIDAKKLKETAQQAGKFTSDLMIAIEAINLALVANKLSKSEDKAELTINSIALLGALADLANSLEHLMKEGSRGQKFAQRAGLIAAVIDYVCALADIWSSEKAGKHGLTSAHVATALGATFVAAGAATELGLASGAAFGVTLTATSWTVIGAVLFLLGAALVWYFHETPLEEWFKKCQWRRGDPPTMTIIQQFDELLKLLAEPKVEVVILGKSNPLVGLFPYKLQLSIKPGFFIPGISKYTADIDMTAHAEKLFEDNLVFMSEKGVKLPDTRDKIITRNKGSIESIIREWDWEKVYDEKEQRKLPVRDTSFLSYKVLLHVDIFAPPKSYAQNYEKKGILELKQI
jgi:hypothetical protein